MKFDGQFILNDGYILENDDEFIKFKRDITRLLLKTEFENNTELIAKGLWELKLNFDSYYNFDEEYEEHLHYKLDICKALLSIKSGRIKTIRINDAKGVFDILVPNGFGKLLEKEFSRLNIDSARFTYEEAQPLAKIPTTTQLIEHHIKELEEKLASKKRGAPFKPNKEIELLGFLSFFEKGNALEYSIPVKLQTDSKRVIFETLKLAGIINDDVEHTWQGKNRNKNADSYIDYIHKKALGRYSCDA